MLLFRPWQGQKLSIDESAIKHIFVALGEHAQFRLWSECRFELCFWCVRNPNFNTGVSEGNTSERFVISLLLHIILVLDPSDDAFLTGKLEFQIIKWTVFWRYMRIYSFAGESEHPSAPVVGSCALHNCRSCVPVLCYLHHLLTLWIWLLHSSLPSPRIYCWSWTR